ncbi:hypothetical protein C8F04DRAFT_1100658 [Mycena alexandri]|uniref:Uncharacterized protein n=1 Tax=Mycena alexandri TaxID=1745969 RepID=A0AAD6SVP6_9AGAR|nr:hypothetical protein C8F04DRAFT_1100658 [Mycena alexandri]
MRSRVRKILMAAMGNSSEGFNSLELADRRYIYLDAQKRWRYSGEIVFRAIFKLAVELEDCMQYFHVQHWLNCIPLVRNNPAMLDYAIEYALTAELRNGLRVGSKDFFPAIPLRSLPAGGRPSKLAESGIYVPMEFNHRYIDCVAVFLDPRNSTSEITIFQISNVQRSSDHSDSEAKFFEDSGDYLLWQEAMPDDFKLTWNFVWLINTPAGVPPPAPYHKKKGPKITDGPPARTVYTVGIKSVSKAVDDALRSL